MLASDLFKGRAAPFTLALLCCLVTMFIIGACDLSHADPGLPRNVLIESSFSDAVNLMLVGSATFRTQCDRLRDVEPLIVYVRLDRDAAVPASRRSRAEGVIQRYQFGRIKATVTLWSDEHAVELIAHELEHVIEYMEGVDYRRLALTFRGGVWNDGSDRFETNRAIQAGARVAAEVARARSRRIEVNAARGPTRPLRPGDRPLRP
jgi:hypothetical protein